MKTARTNRITRAVIVAMTLLGWIVLSNHCALGQMAHTPQARKTHACCQNGEPKQEQQPPVDGKPGLECCKALHVILPIGAKIDLSSVTYFVAVLATTLTLEDKTGEPVVVACDSGPPPRAATFSELVLQRSLRSHAPPFFA